MAYIDNTETKIEFNDAIRGNAVSNTPTNKVGDTVQPVINVNPKDYRVINICKRAIINNATTGTVYTTPTNKDFYLCGVQMSLDKDNTATSTSFRTDITINGETIAGGAMSIVAIALTAEQRDTFIAYPRPIKIDRGTNITINSGTNVANFILSCVIWGYTVEP